MFYLSIGINKHYYELIQTIGNPKVMNKIIIPKILYCFQRNNNISLSNEMTAKLFFFSALYFQAFDSNLEIVNQIACNVYYIIV